MNVLTYIDINIRFVLAIGIVLYAQDKQLNALNFIKNTDIFTFKLPRK